MSDIIKKFDFTYEQDELYLVGDALLDSRGLVSHHLESANNFYSKGIKQIITQGFKIEREIINQRSTTDEDKEIEWVKCEVIPTDVTLKSPTTLHYKTSKEMLLYPRVALTREKIYSGSLTFDCDIKLTAHNKDGSTKERTAQIKNFKICKVPIVKGSIMCNTYGMSKEALMRIGEDPSDPGGYFIVKAEWCIDNTENITFNQPKIYINKGYKRSRVRCEFISKPGDTYQNSAQTLIQYYTDNQLTIEVSRDKMMGIELPFYLVYRALGWSSDKQLLDWIIFDYDSDINKQLINEVIGAMNANYGNKQYRTEYVQVEVLKHIVDYLSEYYTYLDLENKPENYQIAINDVLRMFDMFWLPHIGQTPASRNEKLKFISLLIRKTILTYLGDIPETDRDSYKNKRIHPVGDNYAKVFKTYFNQAVVMPIKRRMYKDVNSTPFSQINLPNLVKSAIYADDFERLIVQTIISGNKSNLKIKKRTIVNRLSSQLLYRKNQLNVYTTLRQIVSKSSESAKQSERASEMRRVHMSSIGYVCTTHSPPEGEKVGINKQFAIFAFIAPSSSSEVLKKMILEDPQLINDNLQPIEIAKGLARVFVNGHLLGYVEDSIQLVDKYRNKRRNLQINPYTTIYWDNVQNEVQFFVDIGRMCRPLLIVYNNMRDSNVQTGSKKFQQGLAICKQDIQLLYQKKKTIDDLLKEKKIEYITPEEQECCYVCPNFEQLKRDANDPTKQYTHCDIPQSMLGITALTAPFGHHNANSKVIYQTTQSKQTCGHYAMNWPYRIDKETFLQYINEQPIVRTITNKYLFANGTNCMVAIMCYSGYNQEDSLIINKAAIDRGMFDGSKFSFYKTELEQKEEIGNPVANKTDSIKPANYNKLVDGVIPRNTIITKNDVLIGKYMNIPKNKNSNFEYLDRSIVYKENEDAIVHNIVSARNEDDVRFMKVAVRKIRPVVVGDKFCLRPSVLVKCIDGWKQLRYITIKDKIATLNMNTMSTRYDTYIEKPAFYSQTIIHLITPDTYCTANHRLVVYKNGKYSLRKISQLIKKNSKPVSLMRFCDELARRMTYVSSSNNVQCTMYELNGFSNTIPALVWDFSIDELAYLKQRIDVYAKCTGKPLDDIPSYRRIEKLVGEHQCNWVSGAVDIHNMINEYVMYCNSYSDGIQNYKIVDWSDYKIISNYKNTVMCLTMPNETFCYKENEHSTAYWSGNSSRAGQKGICALLMNEADMPFTKDGIRPAMIFNPHGIPSRMTMSQLIESQIGNLCAVKGTHIDGTMFKRVGIEAIADELEELGMHRYGYERMYSGVTGEPIDSLIFFGPTYYQRLQKFVADAEYSVQHALTDAITYQPLEGQSSQGGLRLGEMERDVLASHGSSRTMLEKFFYHSDGYLNYVCRCGKPAIVNHKENLYKCKYCGDAANIVCYPTSWTSKLFMQEIESLNIGIRQIPKPFVYET